MMKARTGWQRYVRSWADHHGGYDLRRAPAPVRRWQRLAYLAGRGLARLRVSPVAVTATSLVLAFATPFLAANGRPWLLAAAAAALLAAFAGAVETTMALLAERGGPAVVLRGTVAARLREIAWLIAFFVLGVTGPLVVACGVVSGLHEYVRAQAPAAGLNRFGMQTTGDHSTRVAATVVGLTVAGLAGDSLAGGVAAMAAVVWLLLAVLGLAQLLGAVRRALR